MKTEFDFKCSLTANFTDLSGIDAFEVHPIATHQDEQGAFQEPCEEHEADAAAPGAGTAADQLVLASANIRSAFFLTRTTPSGQ